MSTDNRPLLLPQALENLLFLVLQDEKFHCYTMSLAKIKEALLLFNKLQVCASHAREVCGSTYQLPLHLSGVVSSPSLSFHSESWCNEHS